MMKKVLISGADRGVGFALTKSFLKEGWMVFAGQYMKEWGELAELQSSYPDALHIIPLDVSEDPSVKEAYKIVSSLTECIDMLVSNAGISGGGGDIYAFDGVQGEGAQRGVKILNTNCIGALRITDAFLPLMERSGCLKRLCYVSSEAGSISVCHREDGFIYPMSKTALNMAVKLLFKELYPQGYSFRLYHPGWVRSYMSGKKSVNGKFEPEETAESALRYFLKDEPHEDILRLIDNENVTWPF
ncbi:MAG: SDR family NAD(P)-dependent oxidoreductase [Treponema sp.]|jgi:NAD(P)-dependent dehydrogenase (short-subunit alcohol dehydrogenase family)|nr:SDR family NAD(P)-dependent oxidoreductase [Treponema sp.]